VAARAVLGVLLAANLAALGMVIWPVGGTPEQLERQIGDLRRDIQRRQAAVAGLRALAAKVEKGRIEGDRFLDRYFLARRTAYSTLVGELSKSAQNAGIRYKEHSFAFEGIEGSDTLAMMTITGNYEGTYADLIEFINALDRSGRFLIVESMQAAPQQSGGMLSVLVRMNAFVRDDGSGPPPEPAEDDAVKAAAAGAGEPRL
jgi:type IV pilus assembly protein PilO